MSIKGINHVTINVKNIKASKEFYNGILGFEFLEIVDMGDHKLTYFQIPGGARLELITYDENIEITTKSTNGGIYRHVAFEATDIKVIEEKMRHAGIEITLPITKFENLGCYVLIVNDPNGVEVEFMQKL